jgi:prevent-host-death family protein
MVEVGITELRRQLRSWLDRARAGEEVVVTDRGHPVARLTGIDVVPVLDRLYAEGRIGPAPEGERTPVQRGVPARGSVAELVVAEREARR